MRNLASVMVLSLAILGAACAPRYQVPQSTIAAPQTLAATGTSEAAFEAEWWRQFEDPVLDGLMAQALSANRDLQAAASRFAAATELAGAAALLRAPRGGATAVAARQHLSASETPGDAGSGSVSRIQAAVGVAWEADLFGRLRETHRAAVAEAAASAMDVRGAQVAIAAQVAAAYFELRGAEQDLALIDRLQSSTQQQLETTRALIAAGRVTRLDLLRAQQVEDELAVARSAALHRAERARHRLATLTAQPAGTLQIDVQAPRPLRASTLAIGAPSELLRRRPDVAGAEARVQAAAARAGIARAELFPRVEISGTVGLVAGSVGRLADAASGSWVLAPRLVWNALDWPRLRREWRAAGALADAAFADYEQTVLVGIEEAETAIDAYAAANRELQAFERRAGASADTANVVFIQYREGFVDSLARTQAERDAIAGALDANRALTAHRMAVVGVYRALGGGWR